ncbi:hypothetical protein CEXT_584801 [Caerostris extrusa]|uniref:Uncharacterized protein n=1 Tax=Caerostris extrusa TaxID=172846 RepID=A0AAV4T2N3_CAEEX|nr:hypothetical protein CEXT_584801 [Caerostris extrusa]
MKLPLSTTVRKIKSIDDKNCTCLFYQISKCSSAKLDEVTNINKWRGENGSACDHRTLSVIYIEPNNRFSSVLFFSSSTLINDQLILTITFLLQDGNGFESRKLVKERCKKIEGFR